uniref:Uncharacterized protein n=1 Tax=Rhizophora mucronata TaxID=61149 RepID=A0A2P2Q5F5_RHIMU
MDQWESRVIFIAAKSCFLFYPNFLETSFWTSLVNSHSLLFGKLKNANFGLSRVNGAHVDFNQSTFTQAIDPLNLWIPLRLSLRGTYIKYYEIYKTYQLNISVC